VTNSVKVGATEVYYGIEHAYRSQELLEKVADLVDTADHVGGYFTRDNSTLVFNLRKLAILANAAADHIQTKNREWLEEERTTVFFSEEEEDAAGRRGEDLLDGPADWEDDE
jgi:hypothetical protein